MSNDPVLKMYEAQAELVETRQELERIRRENDELKNERTANNLMKTVDDFQRKYSESLATIQEKLNIHCNSSDQVLSEIKETVRKQNDTLEKQNKEIQALKKNMKAMGNQGFSPSFPDKEAILLLGGWDGKKVVDSILQNNGDNGGSWKQLNIKLPYTIRLHGAQFLSNNLFIFGGTNDNKEVLNSTYKLTRGHKWLTKNSLQWEKIASMNKKRTEISNSSVILNDQIWVIGGWNGNNALNSVEMYDPQTNIWTNMREMYQLRSNAAAAVVNGKIFCSGGSNGYSFFKSAECYDPSSNVWTFISDMPGPNGACGIVVMDEYLIAIGGKASKGKDFLKSVWVLDTTDKNGKWIEKEPCMSIARCQFSIAKIHDKIFVCGGCYIDKKNSKVYVTDDVELFDGEVWRNGPKLPNYLQNSTSVVIPLEFARCLN